MKLSFKNFFSASVLPFSCVLLLASGACSSRTSNFNFDSGAWKSDVHGCEGKRQELQKELEAIRLDLIGLKEYDIRSLFGKPEAEELLDRSNKSYVYYIKPGPKCASFSVSSETLVLKVRIDALGNTIESAITNSL